MAISNSVVVIQNVILELWCLDCVLPSVIILPRFHVGFLFLPSVIVFPRLHVRFLSFIFCNYLASIAC